MGAVRATGKLEDHGAVDQSLEERRRQRRAPRESAHTPKSMCAARAADRGLIVLSCGIYSNVIRVLMPLTMSLELADEGLGILEASMLDAIAT